MSTPLQRWLQEITKIKRHKFNILSVVCTLSLYLLFWTRSLRLAAKWFDKIENCWLEVILYLPCGRLTVSNIRTLASYIKFGTATLLTIIFSIQSDSIACLHHYPRIDLYMRSTASSS
jgi:hypothetical protein